LFHAKQFALAFTLAAATAPVLAQNLIANPSNELPLVADNIQGWTEVTGTNWTQRQADPVAQDGNYYFFAGAGSSALLRQAVDVSFLAQAIDTGSIKLQFTGWVQSWHQIPADTSSINISILDASSNKLDSISTGENTNIGTWKQLILDFVPLPGARVIQIDLVSVRNSGTNNDGYFDNLSLVASPVPESSSITLSVAGLLAALACRARRKSVKSNAKCS
jgi:hypothetical protein